MRQSRFVEKINSRNVIATPVQDVLARLGGDEFAIILPDIVDEKEAISLAEALVDEISRPVIIEDQDIEFGLSIGITYYPEHATSIDKLIRCADTAMYEAKKKQTGYAVYSSIMNENS